ncbi:AAA family ATPase, partial [Solirubrobacter phytolaccae]
MIGRARELARLRDALSAMPALVAITGEPGIGKSHLLNELAQQADGALVLRGRAAEFERELPYGPLVDALDAHLATLDDTKLRGLDTEQLGGIFPALADRAGATPTLAVERYRAHRAVIELLARLAATRPLVLTLDDMHHADPASLELLLALVRRPPAARVLVAVAMRPPAPDGLRDGIRIDLGPLDPDEALELIGTTLPAAQRDAVLRESGGNPFYIEQLVRAGASLPGGVAEAIAGELRALDADQRRLLEGAAVAGDPFEPELAAAAAEVEDPLVLLDALLAAGLVRATDVPRQFAFRHPLVHRAVYEGAPGGWRLAAHGRVAQALAGRGAPPPVLAHHVE